MLEAPERRSRRQAPGSRTEWIEKEESQTLRSSCGDGPNSNEFLDHRQRGSLFITVHNSSRTPVTSFKLKALLTVLNITVDVQEVASVGRIEREGLK